MQFVRLINTDTRNYNFHQQNVKRTIRPGEEAMVPWDLATSLFGDPTTVDTTTEPARTRAWQQAAGIHNFNTVESIAKETGTSAADVWEAMRPKIEVWDVETNVRIFMVLEDQEGLKASGAPAPTNSDQNTAFLLQQIAEMRQQMALLTQAELARQQVTPPTASPVMAGVDGPGDTSPETQMQVAPLPPAMVGQDSPPAHTPVSAEDMPQAVPTGTVGTLAPRVSLS